MSRPNARLAFCKFNVADMQKALDFYGRVFGYEIVQTFDEPEFIEHILAVPGQEQTANLLLVQHKAEKDVTVGGGHGPIGFTTDDAQAMFDRAIAAGATASLPPFEAQGIKIAIILAPDGHEIEFVELPPA